MKLIDLKVTTEHLIRVNFDNGNNIPAVMIYNAGGVVIFGSY